MRRSRTGLSLYLQNTLNSRHMRDATPEERIAALRHLRSANRSTTTAPPLDSEPRSRNRLSARLSRAWGPSSRPPSVVPSANAAPTSDPAEPPRHEEMRRTEEELR